MRCRDVTELCQLTGPTLHELTRDEARAMAADFRFQFVVEETADAFDRHPLLFVWLEFHALCSLSTEDGDCDDSLLHAHHSAAVLRDRDTGAVDLPRVCFAAQLPDQFVDLGKTCCADRMTPAFEPAGRVHRQATTKDGFAALSGDATFARRYQAQRLDFDDLSHAVAS